MPIFFIQYNLLGGKVMFSYTNEKGFNYACKLLSDYLASDYFENCDGVAELRLSEDELKDFFKTRSFKEFMIQRENDYSLLSSHLANISYDYEEGFGNILDINPGRYEVVSAFDSFYNAEALVVTSYADESFFKSHDVGVVDGRIELMGIIDKSKTIYRPVLRTNDFVKGQAHEYPKLTLSSFDTLFYVHDIELHRMLSLLRYSLENDKKLVCGVVTNVFDKNASKKFEQMDEIIKSVIEKVGSVFETEELVTKGSAIKLIHTLK